MRGSDYYTNLYHFQDAILGAVQVAGAGFYLTGGTALSRHYLHHRHSEDLDLFVNDQPDFPARVNRVVKEIRDLPLILQTGTVSASFLRFMALKDTLAVKIDFVNDIPAHYGDFQEASFFHRIDSWQNILSNKICALTRTEPKDIADIVTICKGFAFDWPTIFRQASSKDLWAEPLEMARIIDSFPVDLLETIDWISPTTFRDIGASLEQIRDDIFMGAANSLADSKSFIAKAAR